MLIHFDFKYKIRIKINVLKFAIIEVILCLIANSRVANKTQ